MFNNHFVPSPSFQTTVSLYQIFFACIFTFVVGLFLQPGVTAFRLWRRYCAVPGRYSVQRVHPNNSIEDKDGEIEIGPKWRRGFFTVTAKHADGKAQWKGEMHLSLDMTNVGHGVFWHVDEGEGVGDQKFRYIPERAEFRVQGITFDAGSADSFFHRWTKK
jgi:hypothetical protein